MSAPDPDLPGNVVAIAAALSNPVDAPAMGAGDPDDTRFDGLGDELDRKPLLPDDSPVKALGLGTDGKTCCYLSRLGQLVDLSGRDHSKNNIYMLFAPSTELPDKYWPQWSAPVYEGRGNARTLVKPSEIVGFDQGQASQAMIEACGRRGIFDAQGKVRGRGAHAGRGGALILHTGDKVMVARRKVTGKGMSTEWFDPGLHDGFVYPAAGSVARPHHDPVGEDAGEEALALLGTWHWARPDIDAMLALGWAGQAYICGALPWRSHVIITGSKGTGKSTLNGEGGVFDLLLGGASMRTGSATEAAVRQTLRAQTIPVIFDEFEPNDFNKHKMSAVVELARVASSGGTQHKGSSDHKAQEFVLKSCFQFSAIMVPPLEPQDLSRFAILEMLPFAKGTAKIDPKTLGLDKLGRRLQRRMVDAWPRYERTYKAYWDALNDVGHVSRGCDQFGTLLTCAHLLLYDEDPTEETLHAWASKLAPQGLAEISDAPDEHERCINVLRTSSVQARGGEERESLSTWFAEALERDGDKARKRLEQIGMKLVAARPYVDKGGRTRTGAYEWKIGDRCYLAIAQAHEGLSALFRGHGKYESGQWTTALGRTPGAHRSVKTKFARAPLTATLVPIEAVLGDVDTFGARVPDETEFGGELGGGYDEGSEA